MKLKHLISIVCASFLPSSAHSDDIVGPNFGDWTTRYYEAERAGELSSCLAAVDYSNAGFFLRVYGDEMGLGFFNDSLTLPYNQSLGVVNIKIDDLLFFVGASTRARAENDREATTNFMDLWVLEDNYVGLFSAIAAGRSMRLIFPNDDSYPVSLRGSSAALDWVSACWQRMDTGAHVDNPFHVPNNNPFE